MIKADEKTVIKAIRKQAKLLITRKLDKKTAVKGHLQEQ
jgi:hypothetical protein